MCEVSPDVVFLQVCAKSSRLSAGVSCIAGPTRPDVPPDPWGLQLRRRRVGVQRRRQMTAGVRGGGGGPDEVASKRRRRRHGRRGQEDAEVAREEVAEHAELRGRQRRHPRWRGESLRRATGGHAGRGLGRRLGALGWRRRRRLFGSQAVDGGFKSVLAQLARGPLNRSQLLARPVANQQAELSALPLAAGHVHQRPRILLFVRWHNLANLLRARPPEDLPLKKAAALLGVH
mmetsp:Transcript_133543/g.386564  ORF Transcript_133543/g.386564 Transcript_133543/m.386564 type:complete len:232 (+) Transcript_133543:313-1008(+)